MLIPVILAGGQGTRLWPLSRPSLPKQFIHFSPDGSLFQLGLQRLEGLPGLTEPLVLGNVAHRFVIGEQLRQCGHGAATILLEPVGRNTAPAVAMAALVAIEQEPDAVLLVLPADHRIENRSALHRAIAQGMELATAGRLVTFGVTADSPATGYGYIERGEALHENAGAFRVARFVEKPDLETAARYLAAGNYHWNSGMFMFGAATWLEELRRHAADIESSSRSAWAAIERDADFLRIPEHLFSQCRSDSIDYAVMEKTASAVVIPLDAGWSDLGAWDAIWEVEDKDDHGNVISGEVLSSDVRNSYIRAESRLVATLGLEDTVIVETADAVLVANRQRMQSLRRIVEQLEHEDRLQNPGHQRVFRPWGSWRSLAAGDGWQVKHIVVNPGEALSLQLHHRRSEHWTVIQGSGVVRCGDVEKTLGVNESAFIPLGSRHRLANPGVAPVEIIEVQIGDYLGEDDIVRFEDRYGRVTASAAGSDN